jgi:Tfp pilus assembly protein PilV
MSQNNALVEIALALAMAFFSIMVLAMVSMGVPKEVKQTQKSVKKQFYDVITLQSSTDQAQMTSSAVASDRIKPNQMIVFYQNRFMDTKLKEIPIDKLDTLNTKVVAVEPSIPAAEALRIQKIFKSNSVAITLLNSNWLKRLKEN